MIIAAAIWFAIGAPFGYLIAVDLESVMSVNGAQRVFSTFLGGLLEPVSFIAWRSINAEF